MPESIRSRVLDLLSEMERRQSRDRARLAGLESAARRARRQIEARDHQLRELSSAFGEKFLAEGLTIGNERGINSHDMQAAEYAAAAKVTGRPPESEHPFVLALRRRKMNVAQWARAHGLKRPKVMSWISDDPKNARRIPKAFADEIRREFRVPLSAWPAGVREDD